MKKLEPKSENQRIYIESLNRNKITFADGVSGSGKTYCATVYGIAALLEGKFEKLIITRPLIQSDADSGALPGTLDEKIEPYLAPVLDILSYTISPAELQKLKKDKKIEFAPIGYLRGRTFYKSFVIIDEAENLDYEQLLLVLTRFGKGSKMVLTGDSTQSDLPATKRGGYASMMTKLSNIQHIGIIHLEYQDIVRDPIIKTILERLNDETQENFGIKC